MEANGIGCKHGNVDCLQCEVDVLKKVNNEYHRRLTEERTIYIILEEDGFTNEIEVISAYTEEEMASNIVKGLRAYAEPRQEYWYRPVELKGETNESK